MRTLKEGVGRFREKAKELAGDLGEIPIVQQLKKRATDLKDKVAQNPRVEVVVTKTGEAMGKVSRRISALSGEEQLKKIVEYLDLQSGYNDILATKLAEGLDRITALEQRSLKK